MPQMSALRYSILRAAMRKKADAIQPYASNQNDAPVPQSAQFAAGNTRPDPRIIDQSSDEGDYDESLSISASSDSDDDAIDSHSSSDEPPRSAFREKQNTSGWRVSDVCAMLFCISKKHGIANSVLDQILSLVALVTSTPKHLDDSCLTVPKCVRGAVKLLNLNGGACRRNVYICPRQIFSRKRGETVFAREVCGFTLRETGEEPSYLYHCDLCGHDWDRTTVNKDGNHFVTCPVNWIVQTTMGKFGRYVSLPREPADGAMGDIADGKRYRDMDLQGSDLAVLVHSDGGDLSKSTQKKLYLIFVQCMNVLWRLRRTCWFLQSIWSGLYLPKDREAFFVELTKQLTELQPGSVDYRPISWTDQNGVEQLSSVYPHSLLMDSPERAAVSGHLAHSAKQGCIYCEQVGICIRHRICYPFDQAAAMKTHAAIMEMARQWDDLSSRERKQLRTTRSTHGFKRHSVVMKWEKFDVVEGFCLDIMHGIDEGVSKYFLCLLVDPDSTIFKLTARQHGEIEALWQSIIPSGNENRRPRPLREYKNYKAHELRFFLLYGLPYITRNVVTKDAYKVFCIASNIGYICTLDELAPIHLDILEELCPQFMQQFETVFGESEMKFSIHLMSHVWFAATLFGPLSHVSCYGPEDSIGKISRKVLSMNNTSKHIMNACLHLTRSTLIAEEVADGGLSVDHRMSKLACRVLGRNCSVFKTKDCYGTCTLIGKPTCITPASDYPDLVVSVEPHQERPTSSRIYTFNAALLNAGFRIRVSQPGHRHTGRNERDEEI
ncbi:hypothetical protein BV898_18480 [Hypsibius exemplaris]|uniref:Uncharacterized protein n=1 Tax=Hypsibius exemplaris TaxID=2072580 RepID=A0A9X6NJD4_HYPEX|nr:hypothetical protein BV898_18480 [Hypsibius exemplaris]